MKRLVLTFIAGAFGSLLVLPIAHAQDWNDINGDAWAIHQGHRNIQHDKQELREDLENGDYDAAAREQAEIEGRRAAIRDRQEDLNNDLSNRYYGYGYRHHYDDDDD
jgi:hypothetical protein